MNGKNMDEDTIKRTKGIANTDPYVTHFRKSFMIE